MYSFIYSFIEFQINQKKISIKKKYKQNNENNKIIIAQLKNIKELRVSLRLMW
jgi:hypothetical protein